MTENVFSLIDPEPPGRYRFDYIGMHRYYIALPVAGGRSVFTGRDIVVATLNALRDSAFMHHFDVYAYCFLPDQLVLIVRGKKEDSHMKEFITHFRRSTAESLEPQLGHSLWKKKYLERVLRKSEDTRVIAESVFRLPVRAGLVAKPSEYPYQGSFVVIQQMDEKRKRRVPRPPHRR